jgi:hypothetical protein
MKPFFPESVIDLPLATAVVRSTAVALLVALLRVFRLALVLQSFFCLVAGEGTSKSAEETVVCLSSKHSTADSACYGSHQAAVSLLAVGIVRVAVGIVRVCLTVLVALLTSSRRRPLLLLVGVARVALCLSAKMWC